MSSRGSVKPNEVNSQDRQDYPDPLPSSPGLRSYSRLIRKYEGKSFLDYLESSPEDFLQMINDLTWLRGIHEASMEIKSENINESQRTVQPSSTKIRTKIAASLLSATLPTIHNINENDNPQKDAKQHDVHAALPISPSYVSMINEYCQKNNLPRPKYVRLGKLGADHQPIYSMRVELCDVSATGNGNSIRAAKQEAAKNLWLHMNQSRENYSYIPEEIDERENSWILKWLQFDLKTEWRFTVEQYRHQQRGL